MRGLLILICITPLFLFAQKTDPYEIASMPKDSPPGGVKQGVIKVRKPVLHPYFKCEYYLTLSRVQQVEVLVPANDGIPGSQARDLVPVFDSAYNKSFERIYPQKMINFAQTLSLGVQYVYPFDDTARIDTMIVQMWIGKNGKIRWRDVDTSYETGMPPQLEMELYSVVNDMTDWGKGGGYMTPKKFMRKQKRIAENYYCKLYIIVSSHPITPQQKSTGAYFTTFDIPLNSPPDNPEQKDFLKDNRDDSDSIAK